ncbi:MAG: hypothetical protein KVP17_002654 [Porospora cf. gigantea B]|nr:MAG: hypothetical protein KVP17_002654 [Porospora cf. gigantea B]
MLNNSGLLSWRSSSIQGVEIPSYELLRIANQILSDFPSALLSIPSATLGQAVHAVVVAAGNLVPTDDSLAWHSQLLKLLTGVINSDACPVTGGSLVDLRDIDPLLEAAVACLVLDSLSQPDLLGREDELDEVRLTAVLESSSSSSFCSPSGAAEELLLCLAEKFPDTTVAWFQSRMSTFGQMDAFAAVVIQSLDHQSEITEQLTRLETLCCGLLSVVELVDPCRVVSGELESDAALFNHFIFPLVFLSTHEGVRRLSQGSVDQRRLFLACVAVSHRASKLLAKLLPFTCPEAHIYALSELLRLSHAASEWGTSGMCSHWAHLLSLDQVASVLLGFLGFHALPEALSPSCPLALVEFLLQGTLIAHRISFTPEVVVETIVAALGDLIVALKGRLEPQWLACGLHSLIGVFMRTFEEIVHENRVIPYPYVYAWLSCFEKMIDVSPSVVQACHSELLGAIETLASVDSLAAEALSLLDKTTKALPTTATRDASLQLLIRINKAPEDRALVLSILESAVWIDQSEESVRTILNILEPELRTLSDGSALQVLAAHWWLLAQILVATRSPAAEAVLVEALGVINWSTGTAPSSRRGSIRFNLAQDEPTASHSLDHVIASVPNLNMVRPEVVVALILFGYISLTTGVDVRDRMRSVVPMEVVSACLEDNQPEDGLPPTTAALLMCTGAKNLGEDGLRRPLRVESAELRNLLHTTPRKPDSPKGQAEISFMAAARQLYSV